MELHLNKDERSLIAKVAKADGIDPNTWARAILIRAAHQRSGERAKGSIDTIRLQSLLQSGGAVMISDELQTEAIEWLAAQCDAGLVEQFIEDDGTERYSLKGAENGAA